MEPAVAAWSACLIVNKHVLAPNPARLCQSSLFQSVFLGSSADKPRAHRSHDCTGVYRGIPLGGCTVPASRGMERLLSQQIVHHPLDCA
eukprot:1160695-Pelagomonas_calceolata.AAC.12